MTRDIISIWTARGSGAYIEGELQWYNRMNLYERFVATDKYRFF